MLGIYCRISREKEEGKDRSIEDQKNLGIEKAKELELEYKVYIDEGFSGTLENIDDRPEFSRLIDDIQEEKISAVYAFDQSRLERNPQVRFVIKKILRENNIQLYTYNGLVDLQDDQAEMLGDIVSIMNQYYVKLTTKKVKSVIHRNVKQGKVHSNIYAYGYTKDENGYLVIDNEESKIVKRIYEDSLKGIGTNKIAENLSKEGVPTRYNKIGKGVIKTRNKFTGKVTETKKSDITWSGNTVRNIIKNTIYKGVRKFGGKEYESPILIEPAYWQKVNDNLSKNRNNSGKKVEHKYLLKGVLECGVCGRNMYGRTRTNKKDHYYMCSSKRYKNLNCGNRSINIDFIEKFIWEVVLDDAYVVDDLENENTNADFVEELTNKKIEIEKQILSLNKEIGKVNKLAIEGVLDVNEAIREKGTRKQKIEDFQIRLNNINDEIEFNLNAIELSKTAELDIEKIKLDTPFIRRKELINKYINRVFISYDKSIKFYYIGVKFNTKTGQQNYAFSSNPNRIKKFVQTGEYEITDEEKELIINGIEVDNDTINDYISNYSSARERLLKRK
ncbi:recombinase family protein [Mesoflavibacter zeaxanthinifaciens]|uniref:recombinase family protein n=1 Tax=Mesoflavibacter zeaxanthinifaciens TaxID=393060 RepID=UPI003A904C8C